MSEIFRFGLLNGLRVIYCHDPRLSMVTIATVYNVGARDEDPAHTGLAHLFEHLMFGGSVNIPEFDVPLEMAGGRNNAWTSADYTCFHETLPAQNIETALWLESDRMLSLAFSDKALEVQRSVVVEEFKQVCLNRPYGDLPHKLFSLCYPEGAPYSVPVIGRSFEDVMKTTQDDVRRWFHAHYAPDNAVIGIVGNIPVERLKELVTKWYGDIPRRNIPARRIPVFPDQTEARREVLYGDVPYTQLTLAFVMDSYNSPGYVAADMITDILSNGKGSRFYQQLLMATDLFVDIDASITGYDGPGLLMVNARLRENGEEAENRALEAIRGELARLRDTEVSEAELTRCINRVESDRLFSMLEPDQKAQTLALAELHDEDPDAQLRRYKSLTPVDILATARRILLPTRENLLIYRPNHA